MAIVQANELYETKPDTLCPVKPSSSARLSKIWPNTAKPLLRPSQVWTAINACAWKILARAIGRRIHSAAPKCRSVICSSALPGICTAVVRRIANNLTPSANLKLLPINLGSFLLRLKIFLCLQIFVSLMPNKNSNALFVSAPAKTAFAIRFPLLKI